MEKLHRETLTEARTYLVDNLELMGDLQDYMIESRLITDDVMETILAEKGRKKQVRAFLSKLQTRGPEAFPQLLDCLEKTQPFIAETLRKTLQKMESEMSTWSNTDLQVTQIKNIPQNRLKIINTMGKERFVSEDSAKQQQVALKCPNSPGSLSDREVRSLMEEAELMSPAQNEIALSLFEGEQPNLSDDTPFATRPKTAVETAPATTPKSYVIAAENNAPSSSFKKPLFTLKPGFDNCTGLATAGPCVCVVSGSFLWIRNLQKKEGKTHSLPGLKASGVVSMGKDPGNTLAISSWSHAEGGKLYFVKFDSETLDITHEVKSLSLLPWQLSTHEGKLIIATFSEDIVVCDSDGNVEKKLGLTHTVTCAVATSNDQYVVLAMNSDGKSLLFWVGSDQTITHTYGESLDQNLKEPSHIVLEEKSGDLLVADTNNKKVLLFGSDTKLKGALEKSDSSDDVGGPSHLCVDEENGRLLVSHDSKYVSPDAEILVYEWPL